MRGYYRDGDSENGSGATTGKLKIEITNLPKFRELLDRAEKEANQLQQTINLLRAFEIEIAFSTEKAT